VLEQQGDDLLAGLVVVRVQTELLEALVLPDEIGRWIRKQVEEAFQGGPVERLLQIFDDVARDAALAQDLQRAARFSSTRVVVDEKRFHDALN